MKLPEQRRIFDYAIPTEGRSHERGLTKVDSDFKHSPEHSTLRGDKLSASKHKVAGEVFRTYSHNPIVDAHSICISDSSPHTSHLSTSMLNTDNLRDSL
jgi:hypothetical protein